MFVQHLELTSFSLLLASTSSNAQEKGERSGKAEAIRLTDTSTKRMSRPGRKNKHQNNVHAIGRGQTLVNVGLIFIYMSLEVALKLRDNL